VHNQFRRPRHFGCIKLTMPAKLHLKQTRQPPERPARGEPGAGPVLTADCACDHVVTTSPEEQLLPHAATGLGCSHVLTQHIIRDERA